MPAGRPRRTPARSAGRPRRDRSGCLTAPNAESSLVVPNANSCRLHLPTITAPARFQARGHRGVLRRRRRPRGPVRPRWWARPRRRSGPSARAGSRTADRGRALRRAGGRPCAPGPAQRSRSTVMNALTVHRGARSSARHSSSRASAGDLCGRAEGRASSRMGRRKPSGASGARLREDGRGGRRRCGRRRGRRPPGGADLGRRGVPSARRRPPRTSPLAQADRARPPGTPATGRPREGPAHSTSRRRRLQPPLDRHRSSSLLSHGTSDSGPRNAAAIIQPTAGCVRATISCDSGRGGGPALLWSADGKTRSPRRAPERRAGATSVSVIRPPLR